MILKLFILLYFDVALIKYLFESIDLATRRLKELSLILGGVIIWQEKLVDSN